MWSQHQFAGPSTQGHGYDDFLIPTATLGQVMRIGNVQLLNLALSELQSVHRLGSQNPVQGVFDGISRSFSQSRAIRRAWPACWVVRPRNLAILPNGCRGRLKLTEAKASENAEDAHSEVLSLLFQAAR